MTDRLTALRELLTDDLKTRLRVKWDWSDDQATIDAKIGERAEALARIEELEDKLATCKKYSDAYLEMDRITREALCRTEDKLAQADAMVAATLGKAADLVAGYENHRSWAGWASLHANILALITEDAQTALTKMLAEERAEGMREAVKIADDRLTECEGTGLWLYGSDVGAAILAAADAIQKEGGA